MDFEGTLLPTIPTSNLELESTDTVWRYCSTITIGNLEDF